MQTAMTCPRCLRSPLRLKSQYCPRCGLGDVLRAAADRSPTDIPVGQRMFRLMERIAAGSVSNVYRCRFFEGPVEVEAVAKVAKTLATVEDEELRAALARLGASIKRN